MPRTAGQGSLFERLDPDTPPRRTRTRTRQDMAKERIQAIKRHLEWVLGTRRGCSQSSPELGLPDFNDATIGTADLQLLICQDIRAVIAHYEPRVRVLDVRPKLDGSTDLNFRLRCAIRANNEEELAEIDIMVRNQDRAIRVT